MVLFADFQHITFSSLSLIFSQFLLQHTLWRQDI